MKYLNLFPSCRITKGYNRSCLIDVERNSYCVIPNVIGDFLSEPNCDLYGKLNQFNESDKKNIQEFLKILREKKFIEITHEPLRDSNFFDDSEALEFPHLVQDLLLDLKNLTGFNAILEKLPKHPQFLQVRIFSAEKIKDLSKFIAALSQDFSSVEIIVNNHHENKDPDYLNLFNSFRNLSRLIIMDSLLNEHLIQNQIIKTTERLFSEKQCGKISEKWFFPNSHTVLSSETCNSCLAGKLAIDTNGYIKNCPSLNKEFGHINLSDPLKIYQTEEFQRIWKITKDEVQVCRDCEFRAICTDCRAYLENPKDVYSKPLKCGYDPYTNIWSDWKTEEKNLEAKIYYGLTKVD